MRKGRARHKPEDFISRRGHFYDGRGDNYTTPIKMPLLCASPLASRSRTRTSNKLARGECSFVMRPRRARYRILLSTYARDYRAISCLLACLLLRALAQQAVVSTLIAIGNESAELRPMRLGNSC